MPRSSRRRSSKHSSRDVRDFSDSEDYSGSRDRKSRDESNGRVLKDSASREKRKLEAKEINVKEEYSTSKRRRDRVDDGDDRWNGGDDDSREGTKKLKDKSSESRSRRRDENTVVYVESDEMVKKSGRKTEGKHRDSSSKKEGKEGGWEKDKEREREKDKEKERGRGKEGKTEKLIAAHDLSTIKQASEKTELGEHMDSLPDRRIRKKRDDFSDGDLDHDDLGDSNDRHLPSRGDANKDGRLKEEKRKDERHKDKYRESVNTDYRNRDDNQTDERAGKDHISDKSDYKNSRDDKDNVDIRQKKHRSLDGDRDSERDHDSDFDASGNNDCGSYGRGREQDCYRGRGRDRKHDREWDRKRDRDRDRERVCDQDRSIDYDVLPIDNRTGIRYKDSKGRKRSLDDYDDYADTKSRDFKTDFLETEKRSLNSRIESDDDRGKSQPHQEHAGNNAGSDNATSLAAADECRQPKQEDMKYKDNVIEHRSSKSPGASERNSKHRSCEKHNKMDEGDTEQLSIERSSTSKASPMDVMDRSPPLKSLDRRYTNRSGVRRNLDIEESGRRSNTSMGSRDDDRQNRDLPPEKSLMDESTSVDSPFYNRTSQSNMAPSFRGGIGRGQGNAWRGGPNWTPHLPNGYIPFQHGPHHGAFPAMLPQFPSLFGVRPSMEINHSGIPYHISDADRFASRIGPLGRQTIHRWDGNNGVFRNEQNLYGGPDWDQSRHSMNSQGWEGNSEKGQNSNVNSGISKEDISSQAHVDDVSAGQCGQRPHKEGYRAKAADTKTSSPECTLENIAATPKSLEKENEPPYDAYLSWLDISAELADPELYDQIASFLNVKQSVTAEENFTMLVNLKDGGRAVPKSSSVLLSSLMFSATSDSVFQRAMGIYKRKRACLGGLPIANALIEAILGSKMEEEVPPNNDKTATEEPVLNHNDEVSNVNSVDTKAGSFSPVEEPDDKPMMDSSTSETEVTPSNVEIEISKTETKGSSNLNIEEEMQGKCGPLGSPTTELESVILSRIHHSPESTH